ncbi:UreF-domain-containing protein [Gloeopeniophorella convolvens]|nr:UreF-domain-containing protein [Gloeopeniophorella convolvens]
MQSVDDKEAYLLLLLSDANLPTGSFVASAGLESTAAHALFHVPGPAGADTLAFLRSSVDTYARSALPFARDAHRVAAAYASGDVGELGSALAALARVDALYDASTLNHVTRRASCAQGAALLTLYTKGFTRPPALLFGAPSLDEREARASALVSALKLRVRRGEHDVPGHLPVCWGVLAGALGLTVDRGAHLHLFLHARGVLSAAVRMNALGPYAAQQLLLHAVQPLIHATAAETAQLVSGALQEEDADDEHADERLPATTWPLGEILAARHDLLHSRIFNS